MRNFAFFILIALTTQVFAQNRNSDPFALRHEVFGMFEHTTDVNTYVFDLNTLAVLQNGYTITVDEFKSSFSPRDGDSSRTAKAKHLDDLILFRQKMFHGMDMGVDTSAAFKKEFDSYRNSLIKPLLDKGYSRDEALRSTGMNYSLRAYYGGIVVFDVLDKEVWSKAVKDTAGTRMFFQNHRSLYGTQTYVSARGKVITDYQAELEKQLNDRVRIQFPARINAELLKRI